jgi:hypothetical protein
VRRCADALHAIRVRRARARQRRPRTHGESCTRRRMCCTPPVAATHAASDAMHGTGDGDAPRRDSDARVRFSDARARRSDAGVRSL